MVERAPPLSTPLPARGQCPLDRRDLVPGTAQPARLQDPRPAQHQVTVSKGLSAFGGERSGEGQSPSPVPAGAKNS